MSVLFVVAVFLYVCVLFRCVCVSAHVLAGGDFKRLLLLLFTHSPETEPLTEPAVLSVSQAGSQRSLANLSLCLPSPSSAVIGTCSHACFHGIPEPQTQVRTFAQHRAISPARLRNLHLLKKA